MFFRAQCVMSHFITEETLRKFLEQFGALEHIVIRMFETNALVFDFLSFFSLFAIWFDDS